MNNEDLTLYVKDFNAWRSSYNGEGSHICRNHE
jgi:hypothetical protein